MLENDDRPGPPGAAMASCPVAKCPWRYQMTAPGTQLDTNGVAVLLPLPVGVPDDLIAIGVAAAQAAMAAAGPVRDMQSLVESVVAAMTAQDEAIIGTHLASHPRAQLAATFEDLTSVMIMLDKIGAPRPV